MKARYHKLPPSPGSSFSIARSNNYHYWNDFHYHQELELICIEKGEGTCVIGDRIDAFSSGQLFLIGANVPHMFRFNEVTYQNVIMKQGEIPLQKQMLTLHFDTELFGEKFLALPENRSVVNLFKDASRGIRIFNDTKETVARLLNNLLDAPNEDRILLLMQLLAVMARSADLQKINSEDLIHTFNDHDEKRLTRVYLYTLNNFTRTIKLKDVAEIVYMDPNAFCRYFRSRTHKSYFTFLLEIRVSHACKLLVQHDFNMGIVSFESGFKNISNFNRHFKQITGKTPLEFRNKFHSR